MIFNFYFRAVDWEKPGFWEEERDFDPGRHCPLQRRSQEQTAFIHVKSPLNKIKSFSILELKDVENYISSKC